MILFMARSSRSFAASVARKPGILGSLAIGLAFACALATYPVSQAWAQGIISGTTNSEPLIVGIPESARLDPKNVIQAYYSLISTGSFHQALDLLGPSFGVESVRKIAEEMENLHQRIAANAISISLDEVYLQGDWALAVLIIDNRMEDGSHKKFVADQYLLRLNSRWTVVPKQLREEPQFQSFYDQDAINLNKWWQDNRQKITLDLIGTGK
jgi:hypothetical protein